MFKHTRLKRYLSEKALFRLALGLLVVSVATAATDSPKNITKSEMALIPQYCRHTQGFKDDNGRKESAINPSPAAQRWVALMGATFWHMHHYCWGRIGWLRAQRGSTLGALESIAGDYNYVIGNAPPDFVLLPELLTRRGEVELRLGRPNDANKSFAEARALKPDYWPAYSHWVEFLLKSGKSSAAKEVVKSGLEYSQNSRVLREQYRLLGGNPSAITPRVKEPATASGIGETTSAPIPEGKTHAKDSTEAVPGTSRDY